MLTHVGLGYSPDFVANFRRVLIRLVDGEEVSAVDGPDDLCAPLLGDPDAHCRRASVSVRDDRARAAIRDHLGLDAGPSRRLVLDVPILRAMRDRFRAGDTRAACAGCEWADLCSRVAGDGYRDTVLR